MFFLEYEARENKWTRGSLGKIIYILVQLISPISFTYGMVFLFKIVDVQNFSHYTWEQFLQDQYVQMFCIILISIIISSYLLLFALVNVLRGLFTLFLESKFVKFYRSIPYNLFDQYAPSTQNVSDYDRCLYVFHSIYVMVIKLLLEITHYIIFTVLILILSFIILITSTVLARFYLIKKDFSETITTVSRHFMLTLYIIQGIANLLCIFQYLQIQNKDDYIDYTDSFKMYILIGLGIESLNLFFIVLVPFLMVIAYIIRKIKSNFRRFYIFCVQNCECLQQKKAEIQHIDMQVSLLKSNRSSIVLEEEKLTKEDELSDDTCIICLSEVSSVIFINCGHLVTCQACGPEFEGKDCPMCRQKVEKIIHTNNQHGQQNDNNQNQIQDDEQKLLDNDQQQQNDENINQD